MPMRPVMLLVLVVLLSVHRADGIRFLDNEYSTTGLLTKVEEKRILMENDFRAEKGCGSRYDHQCSGTSGKVVMNAMGTHEGKRSNKIGLVGEAGPQHVDAMKDVSRSRKDFQVESPASASAQPPTYPDAIDIAGMDYSPAKRKPPIHN